MSGPDFFRSCQSPVDLMCAVGVEPISKPIECVLDASCATTPTKQQRAIFRTVSQQPWPTTAPKRCVWCMGRGSTKTTAGAWLGAFHLLCVDHDEHAMSGTRIYNAAIAPKKQQAAESVKILCSVLEQLAPLGVRFDVVDSRGEDTEIIIVEPKTSCVRVSAVWAAENASPRGYAFAFLHYVECGHAKSGADYKTTDKDLVQAILPRMAQFPRAQALFESTPGPPKGIFFDLVSEPPAETLLVRGSSFLFNPKMPESRARAWAPDEREYEQEILATRFGFGGESFLDPDACEACLE